MVSQFTASDSLLEDVASNPRVVWRGRSIHLPNVFLRKGAKKVVDMTNQTVGIMCIYMCISHNPGPGKFVLSKTCNLDLTSQLLSDFLKQKLYK